MGFRDAALALISPPRGPGAALADSFAPSISAAYGATSTMSDPDGWFMRAIQPRTDSGVPVNEWSAINLPVFYSCLSLISDNIAQLPCNVHQKLPNGGATIVADHPLQFILHDEFNEDMTSFVARQTMTHHACGWGNGYGEIERNGRGEPLGIWPLYPDRTRPFKPTWDPSARLVYQTSIAGQRITIPAADVLHIPALSYDGYLGISPVAVARQGIGLALAMERFGAKFFANDAKSGGFLLHPGKLGGKAVKNVSDSFMDQGRDKDGQQEHGRVRVLEEGMKFISTTIAPDDAQFLSSREFQVAEIARIFRVPLVLLQSMEKTTSWGSGIEQIMIGFVVWTIQPWVKRWEDELNRKLLTREERAKGLFIKFNLNALLRGDMKARGQFYKDLQTVRAIFPNEIRDREDLNPYPGGDEMPEPQGAAPPPADASSAEEPPEPPAGA